MKKGNNIFNQFKLLGHRLLQVVYILKCILNINSHKIRTTHMVYAHNSSKNINKCYFRKFKLFKLLLIFLHCLIMVGFLLK
jgi:hypothetical protein